jgi:alkylation response protein AidB-like acyl-CoA dehydrogenase
VFSGAPPEAERDMNAEYVTRRIQFGHPIGSFQAVKHRAAESAVRAESAWCQTVVALLHCAAAAPDAGLQIASAKVVAAEAAVLNGRDNIQNHGAIGFTAEHDAHLFLKRAHLYAAMLGGPRHHLRALFDS